MNLSPRRIDKPLALYGKGNLGKLAKEIFYELGIRPAYVFDRECSFETLPKDVLVAICVATEPYYPIAKTLQDAGWNDVMPMWNIIEAYPEMGIHNGWFAGKLGIKDKRGIRSLCWDDSLSFSHYNVFLDWRINRNENVFDIKTINDNGYKCLPSTLIDIRKRQKTMLWPDRPIHRPIVIHLEGKEMKTLNAYGNMEIFQKRRPKIEVSCYHSRDGLWKIEKYLMDNLKGYRFTFRLYAYQGQGAHMYCTPKERI